MTRLEAIRAILAAHAPTKDDEKARVRVIYALPDPEKLKVSQDATNPGR